MSWKDIDEDGRLELIVAPSDFKVYVYDLETTEWDYPKFMFDPFNTGTYDRCPPAAPVISTTEKIGGNVRLTWNTIMTDVYEAPEVMVEQPARPASFVSDVGVPAAQAMITGALVGGLVLSVLGEVAPGWDVDRVKLYGAVSLAVGAISWLFLLVDTRKLLWGIERLIGLDIDRNNAIGDPTKRRIEVHVKDGQSTRIVGTDWLEMDDDRLILFAAGIVRGRGLTEGEWAKEQAVFPKGINEFRAVRGRLAAAGMIEKVNPDVENSTYRPTVAGRAFFKRVAEYAHVHTHTNG